MTELRHNTPWKVGELDGRTLEDLQETFFMVPYLTLAIQETADTLTQPGDSLAFFMRTGRTADVRQTLITAAEEFARMVYSEGIADFEEMASDDRFPIAARRNERVEDAPVDDFVEPEGAKGSFDHLVGYVRVERTDSGPSVTVGCFDISPEARVHYSVQI